MLRNMYFVSPLAWEFTGVYYLIVIFGLSRDLVATCASFMALSFCAWQRSGAHFNDMVGALEIC